LPPHARERLLLPVNMFMGNLRSNVLSWKYMDTFESFELQVQAVVNSLQEDSATI